MSSSTESESGEDGSGLLSDESSFYGDDEVKEQYEARAASFDPADYWKSQEHDLQHIAAMVCQGSQDRKTRKSYHTSQLVKEEKSEPVKSGTEVKQQPIEAEDHSPTAVDRELLTNKPYNPYEGDLMAKQLDETLENFLSRLPPSTTAVAAGPWIWIANPSSSQRPMQSDVAGFKTSGNELLEDYLNRKARVEAANPRAFPGSITRMLKADREWLETSIVDLAKSKGMTNGKWMLFPHTDAVDKAWRKVAQATLEGALGCAAKVATDDDRSGAQRLICVYTEDFTDEKDVRRVLERMHELRLITAEQGIYYKCDAYTYLNIMSGNDYKLKASMYSSKEMLKAASSRKR